MMATNNRIGERFTTNEGYMVEIIEYNNCDDLWVQFQDEYKTIKHTAYSCCRNGGIRNPYHPSVYNIGRLGLMSDGSKPRVKDKNNKITREYRTWNDMIRRCYDGKHSSYEDATVCERWLIFANFLEDIKYIEGYELWLNHPNERISLDKDVKGNGSKLYCLENCCFITSSANSIEANNRTKGIKVYGINVKTGERTKDFNSMEEASKELGLHKSNIHACFTGRQSTCGGYKWFKVEKESE